MVGFGDARKLSQPMALAWAFYQLVGTSRRLRTIGSALSDVHSSAGRMGVDQQYSDGRGRGTRSEPHTVDPLTRRRTGVSLHQCSHRQHTRE